MQSTRHISKKFKTEALKPEPRRFYVNDPKDKAALEAAANFKYVENYVTNDSSLFAVFNSAEFKQINEQFHNFDPYVALVKKIDAFGAYSAKSCKLLPGEKMPLCAYWGKLLDYEPKDQIYVCKLHNYDVDAKKYGNWPRFINHSTTEANVSFDIKEVIINGMVFEYFQVCLIKSVEANEQLLANYGFGSDFDFISHKYINPMDNEDDTQTFFNKHQNQYTKEPVRLAFSNQKQTLKLHEVFNLTNALCYQPIFMAKTTKQELRDYLAHEPHIKLDLPLLLVDESNTLLPNEDQPGITALMLAAYAGNLEMVEALLEAGATLERQHAFTGQTALFYAIQSNAAPENKHSVIQYLLKHYTHLHTQDQDELTVIHLCIKNNDIETLKLFFSTPHKEIALTLMGDKQKDNVDCPMMYALTLGHADVLNYLAQKFSENRYEYFANPSDDFLGTLASAIKHSKNFNNKIFDIMMCHGLAQNKSLMVIMPFLKNKNIKINADFSHPAKMLVTFEFPEKITRFYFLNKTGNLEEDLKEFISSSMQESSLQDHSLFAANSSTVHETEHLILNQKIG